MNTRTIHCCISRIHPRRANALLTPISQPSNPTNFCGNLICRKYYLATVSETATTCDRKGVEKNYRAFNKHQQLQDILFESEKAKLRKNFFDTNNLFFFLFCLDWGFHTSFKLMFEESFQTRISTLKLP